MGIFTKLNSFIGRGEGKKGIKSVPMYGDRGWASVGESVGKDGREVNLYEGSAPWAAVAVDIITREVAAAQWGFVDKNGKELDIASVPEEIKEPFLSKWSGLSFKDKIKFTIPSRLLAGNSFLWSTKGTKYGEINGINDVFIPLAPGRVTIALSDDKLTLSHYEVDLGDGKKVVVDQRDIIHSKQNPVINPFIGIGAIAKGRLIIEGDIAASEYINTFLVESNKMPLSIITDKGDVDEDEVTRLRALMASKYSSKMAYLVGDINIENSSLIQKDFKFIEMRQESRQTVLSLFGVPPESVGITEGSNRATSKAQINLFRESTINPLMIDLADEYNEQHVSKFSNSIFFRFKPYATGDTEIVVKKMLNGIITPNRAAELCGEEFDPTDEARETFYMPSSLLPIGFTAPEEPATPEAEPVEEPEDIEEEPDEEKEDDKAAPRLNDLRNSKAILEHFTKSATAPKQFQRAYLAASIRSRLQVEDKFVKKVSDFFDGQEKRIIANLKANTPKGIKADISANVLIQIEEEKELFEEVVQPLHTSGVQKAVSDINRLSGYAVNLNTSNPFVTSAIGKLGSKVTGFVQDTTLKELQTIVTKGVNESWNVNQFQDAIQGKFDQFQGYRARMIARTESRAAWDAGADVAYREIGVTKVDVVGCTEFESDSACGKQNIPIEEVSSLEYHPNHIGNIAPSKQI